MTTDPIAPFVLDRVENPHPVMLAAALRLRNSARTNPRSPVTRHRWLGYRDAMCDATGCTPDDIEAWMDQGASRDD